MVITTAFQKPDSTAKTRRGRHSVGDSSSQTVPERSTSAKKPLQRRSGEAKAATTCSITNEAEMTKRKARISGANQSESLSDVKLDTGGYSPRKKRLRSVDKVHQQLPSREEVEVANPSPAKKPKASSFKTSNKSTSVPSVQVSKDSSPKRHTQRGCKKTKEDKDNAKTVVGKKVVQKKTHQTIKQSSDKSDQESNSARSTPKSLYDFTADSPKTLDSNSAEDVSDKRAKPEPKFVNGGVTKRQKPADRKTRLRNRVDPSLITPKTKRCRVVLSPVDKNRGATKKIKVKVDIHSQEEGNKDSLVTQHKVETKGKEKRNIAKNPKKGKTKQIRPVKDSKDNPIPKMPSISFLDNEITAEPCDDDSAIFMSPKTVVPRIKQIKAQETPIISGNIKDKRLRSMDCSFNVDNIQSTSTPNPEPKPDIEPIRDQDLEMGEPKLTPPVFSPVKQFVTPATSDYGSMAVTPSPERDDRAREHSPSPAFSLEDDTGMNSGIVKFTK